jgi:hypothetical protein
MKTKGKKADKKNAASSKKDKKSVATEPTEVLLALDTTQEDVGEIAPAAVASNESIAPAAANVKRRTITNDERRRLISLAAYLRAQRVGFGKTNPVEDWLLAEREVDAMIADRETI